VRGTPGRCLAWLFLSHALAGVLHVQIALSHFFQPCYAGPVRAGAAFVTAQLEGTTDLTVPWWCAWFHGGLQFQATHHVFPRLPRDRLPRARAALRDLCARHGVRYHVCGWWAGNAALLRALAAAGRAGDTRTLRAAWHAVG
jgi:delta8-fatty-acid desaturase